MKRIYFVRHGESESNVGDIVQGLDDPLSPEGEMQAEKIAERALGLPATALFSSDAHRARQTAEAIASAIKLPITFSDALREIRRPTSFVGKPRATDEYRAFLAAEREHMGESGWRFEDEENYDDIKTRAEKALAMLLEHPAEDIIVVTHGHFLRFMVTMIIHDGMMAPELWKQTALTLATTNTGVTVTVHDGMRWYLLTWNDHAHFADT